MQTNYFYFILFSLLTSVNSFANDFEQYDENNRMPANDNPPLAAPIDDWIPYLIMIAILFAFYRISSIRSQVTN